MHHLEMGNHLLGALSKCNGIMFIFYFVSKQKKFLNLSGSTYPCNRKQRLISHISLPFHGCSCHKRASATSPASPAHTPPEPLPQKGTERSKETESDPGLIFYKHKNTLKNPTPCQSGALTEVIGGRRGRRKD